MKNVCFSDTQCNNPIEGYLEKADDGHLVVGDQRLGLCNLSQGCHRRTCALLQPVDDVVGLPARCRSTQ